MGSRLVSLQDWILALVEIQVCLLRIDEEAGWARDGLSRTTLDQQVYQLPITRVVTRK